MKNQIKILGLVGVLGTVATLYAFTALDNSAGQNEKRIEVIRTKDGVTQLYDTLVPINSSLTAEGYLELLGFQNDPMLEIIDLTGSASTVEGKHIIEIEKDVDTESGNDGAEVSVVKVQKIVHLNADRLENEDLDSMINVFIELDDSKGGEVIEEKVISVETEESKDGKVVERKWTSDKEPDYQFTAKEGEQKTEVRIYGDQKDMTLVIVSNADTPGHGQKMMSIEPGTSNADLKVFPNPGNDNLTLTYNFESTATTQISIVDMNGKTVLEMDRGNESGNQNVRLDISKLSTGTYFVNVLHGESKMVKKIVVE